MTQPAYKTLLRSVPTEHRGLVDEICRGLRTALRAERQTRKIYERRLRAVLSEPAFGDLQKFARGKVYARRDDAPKPQPGEATGTEIGDA